MKSYKYSDLTLSFLSKSEHGIMAMSVKGEYLGILLFFSKDEAVDYFAKKRHSTLLAGKRAERIDHFIVNGVKVAPCDNCMFSIFCSVDKERDCQYKGEGL